MENKTCVQQCITAENITMKFGFLFLSLFIISCSTKEKKESISEQTEIITEKVIEKIEKVNKTELPFEKIQDSLRILLLNSKSNENLKSSLLQELYIRGLVNQIDDKIEFKLSFNLHGFDCGAPDCYSTDITFEIPETEPIEFPKTVDFKLQEHGCEIEKEVLDNGVFELIEKSTNYINYYSKKHKSNLVIIGKTGELYYFSDIKPNSIKVDLINKIFDEYNEENENSIVPYQSTIMRTKGYENFIKNK